MKRVVLLACAALLLPAAAVAQTPAGSEYVEQVPTASGGGQTRAAPATKPRPRVQAPQRQAAPSAPASQTTTQSQTSVPTYSAPAQPAKPRKKVRKRTIAAPHPDLPKVASPRPSSAIPSPDLTGGGGGGDSFLWLLIVLAAMAAVIPLTARYAHRHGSR